jgi:hypothetical protein
MKPLFGVGLVVLILGILSSSAWPNRLRIPDKALATLRANEPPSSPRPDSNTARVVPAIAEFSN